MKHTKLAASIFLCCMSVGSAWAAVDLTLFEQDFLRGKGKPDSFAKSFVAQDHKARLIIRNGEESGGKRVSSASVRLNGKEIVGPRDFNQKVSVQEFTVDLLKNNKIAVELASKPGSSLRIQVIQKIDADAAAVVGPEGGVVAVEDKESPIYGAKIEVPAGALDEDIVLTMKEATLHPSKLKRIMLAGPVINFGPDGTKFNNDVLVTLPYSDVDNDGYIDSAKDIVEGNVVASTYNSTFSETAYLSIEGQDADSNTLNVLAEHFSYIFTEIKKIALHKIGDGECKNYYTTGDRIDFFASGGAGNAISMKFEVKKLEEENDGAVIFAHSCNNTIHDGNCIFDSERENNMHGIILTDDIVDTGIYECIFSITDDENNTKEYHRQIAIGSTEKGKRDGYAGYDVSRMLENADRILNNNADFTNFDFNPTGTDCMNFTSRVLIGGFWLTDNNAKTSLFDRLYGMDWLSGDYRWFNFSEKTSGYINTDYLKFDSNEDFVKDIVRIHNSSSIENYGSEQWKGVAKFIDYIENKDSALNATINSFSKNNLRIGDIIYYKNGENNHIASVVDIQYKLNQNDTEWHDEETLITYYHHGNKNYTLEYNLKEVKSFFSDGGNSFKFIRVAGITLPDQLEVSKSLVKAAISDEAVATWFIDELTQNNTGFREKLIDGANKDDDLRNLLIKAMKENDQLNELVTTYTNNNICFKFTDIGKCKDSYTFSLQKMFDLNIINGNLDGTLKADELINRAEFAKLLVLAAKKVDIDLETDIQDAKEFSDVSNDAWYKKDVDQLSSKKIYANRTLVGQGIVQGYSDNKFKPGNDITFPELLKMIVQTFSPVIPSCKEFGQPDKPTVTACATTTEWYDPYLQEAQSMKIKPLIDSDSEWYSIEDEIGNVKRKQAAKAVFDAYCYYCKEKAEPGLSGCQDYAKICPSESWE